MNFRPFVWNHAETFASGTILHRQNFLLKMFSCV